MSKRVSNKRGSWGERTKPKAPKVKLTPAEWRIRWSRKKCR